MLWQYKLTVNIKLKWEKNSRALTLAAQGKIKDEDIIPRTTTDNFPDDVATVRIQRVREKKPHVVIHIKGGAKSRQLPYYSGTHSWATTCRVTLAGAWGDTMCSNGDLDEDYTWQDVHNVVTEVKTAMGF